MNGLKHDQNKTRLDLLPPHAIEMVGRVLTYGAKKYGDRNWLRGGLKWSRLVAAAKRHLLAFEQGQDFDEESQMLHLAHAACNMLMLCELAVQRPELDDRDIWWRRSVQHAVPRIGLDIDEVLSKFIEHYQQHYSLVTTQLKPTCWDFDPLMPERLKELANNDEFWLSMPPRIDPVAGVPFQPTCYITSRVCPIEVTKQWLQLHGFPLAPIHYTTPEKSKAAIAVEQQLTWFVDDRWENFVEINAAGVCCFLFNSPHNQRYDAGSRRIQSLHELPLQR